MEDGSADDGPVHDPHGSAAGLQRDGGQVYEQKVGRPPGGVFQAQRLRPGELFRHRRHQGLCQGGQGAAGFPGDQPGE